MPRQTADLIALLLTIAVVIVVLATAAAVLYTTLTHPAQDVTKGADAIGRIVSVLIGVLAGYLAGRKINGNGHAP